MCRAVGAAGAERLLLLLLVEVSFDREGARQGAKGCGGGGGSGAAVDPVCTGESRALVVLLRLWWLV